MKLRRITHDGLRARCVQNATTLIELIQQVKNLVPTNDCEYFHNPDYLQTRQLICHRYVQ